MNSDLKYGGIQLPSARASRRRRRFQIVRCVAPGFLLLGTLSGPAQADDPGTAFPYHASVYDGIFMPQSERWSASGTLGRLPFTAAGKLSSNTGLALGGLLDYSFENVPHLLWLNIDLTADYVTSTFNHFTGTIAMPGAGSVGAVVVPVSGNAHGFAGFVNFLPAPSPFDKLLGNRVTPCISVGPGIANTAAKLQSLGLAGATLPVNTGSSETDFAFDAALGAGYALTTKWNLGIAYQYSWIDTKHFGSGAGISAKSGSSPGKSVGLFLEYRLDHAW